MTAIELEGLGFRLSIEGERLIVNPSSKLTPELREAIRANRDALYRELELWDMDNWVVYLSDTGALDTKPTDFRWRQDA